jgi:hypothetical protein
MAWRHPAAEGLLAVGRSPAGVLVVAWRNRGMSMPSQSRTVGHGVHWRRSERRSMSLVVLGVDPHKQSHTATALAARAQQPLGSVRIPASPTG